MITTLKSSVGRVDDDLAKAGVPETQSVIVRVLSAEDEQKLQNLRASIDEGLQSEIAGSGDEVFSRLTEECVAKFPAIKDAHQ